MSSRCRLIPIATLVAVLFLAGSGCQEDNTPLSLVGPSGADIAALRDITGTDNADLHQALQAMWRNTDGVLMQVFKKTIDCRTGGVFSARPVGWPEGYDVVLTVDPGTLPLNHDPVVEFVMEIPVTGPATAVGSVPYEFHPDGIRFNQPVHITVAWPEWAGTAPASAMNLWYLENEFHDGIEHYRVVDRKLSEPAPATALSDKAVLAPLGHFSIDHFSRWSVGDDPVGDKSTEPGKGILQTILATAAAGDCCWTELAASPDLKPQLDF